MFHLSREDKRDLAVIGGIIAIIVFILLFHARNVAASPSNLVSGETPQPAGGAIDNFAAPVFPGLDLPVFPGYAPAPNLTPNTATSQCGCGCADDPTQQYLNTAQLENAYLSSSTTLYTNYINQLQAMLPEDILQYVNNETGYQAAVAAQSQLEAGLT